MLSEPQELIFFFFLQAEETETSLKSLTFISLGLVPHIYSLPPKLIDSVRRISMALTKMVSPTLAYETPFLSEVNSVHYPSVS